MSLEAQLAEQMVNENNRLKGENAELMDLNESMVELQRQVEELGGIQAIQEALAAPKGKVMAEGEEEILESFTAIVENYGGMDQVNEALGAHHAFIEKHESLEKVEEALGAAAGKLNQVAEFVQEHGSLEEVSEAMSAIEGRMPKIEEGLLNARAAEEFQAKHGSFEQIEEALGRATEILGAQAAAKGEEAFTAVCESYGLTPEKARGLMEKHDLGLDGLGDLCESFGMTAKEVQEEINESAAPAEKQGAHLMKSMVSGSTFLYSQVEEDVNESVEEKPKSHVTVSRLQRMCS